MINELRGHFAQSNTRLRRLAGRVSSNLVFKSISQCTWMESWRTGHFKNAIRLAPFFSNGPWARGKCKKALFTTAKSRKDPGTETPERPQAARIYLLFGRAGQELFESPRGFSVLQTVPKILVFEAPTPRGVWQFLKIEVVDRVSRKAHFFQNFPLPPC